MTQFISFPIYFINFRQGNIIETVNQDKMQTNCFGIEFCRKLIVFNFNGFKNIRQRIVNCLQNYYNFTLLKRILTLSVQYFLWIMKLLCASNVTKLLRTIIFV